MMILSMLMLSPGKIKSNYSRQGKNLFGYVVANMDKMSDPERENYRACYCGLCRALRIRHGNLSRLTLTYDMTFLIQFLSALYDQEKNRGRERCGVHPVKAHSYWQNEITDYAADMNIVLAYHNFLDDWVDDRKFLALGMAKMFKLKYARVASLYPEKCEVIVHYMQELTSIEKQGELNPDIPANCFAKLLGEVFVWREDKYAKSLRAFGGALGKFIYIMDACLDLKQDIKKERYNPLVTTDSSNLRNILNLLMADCTERYRQLPIRQDQSIIENILYSGIWTRYEADKRKLKENPDHDI
jgi:hypothetical protein